MTMAVKRNYKVLALILLLFVLNNFHFRITLLSGGYVNSALDP